MLARLLFEFLYQSLLKLSDNQLWHSESIPNSAINDSTACRVAQERKHELGRSRRGGMDSALQADAPITMLGS
jgi:hypothetical protein